MSFKDETGNIYGNLTVLHRVENDKNGKAQWECECVCGKKIIVAGSSLRSGNTKSCGCKRASAETAEIGKRYGALTVISYYGRTPAKKIEWLCKCDCGNTTHTTTGHLHSGSVRSCGCGCGRPQQFINEIGNKYGRLTVIEKSTIKHNNGFTYWMCQCECGNIVEVSGASLRGGNTQSCGCINSIGEYNINKILTENNIKYISQVSFPDLIYKSSLKYDFGLLDDNNNVIKLIEFDGPQHQQGNNWHTPEVEIRDLIKNNYAFENNIPLLRIPYSRRDDLTLDDILSDKYILKLDKN